MASIVLDLIHWPKLIDRIKFAYPQTRHLIQW